MASQSVVTLSGLLVRGIGRQGRNGRSIPNSLNAGKGATAGKTIAIVDDEDDLVAVYSTMLTQLGYVVEFTANDGSDVVQAFLEKRIKPDVILVDHRMKTMNGLDAAERIRQVDSGVKIVIVTADDSVEERAKAAGFGYIEKPFSMAQLRDYLKRL